MLRRGLLGQVSAGVEFASLDLLCFLSQLAPRWGEISGSRRSTQQAGDLRKGRQWGQRVTLETNTISCAPHKLKRCSGKTDSLCQEREAKGNSSEKKLKRNLFVPLVAAAKGSHISCDVPSQCGFLQHFRLPQ